MKQNDSHTHKDMQTDSKGRNNEEAAMFWPWPHVQTHYLRNTACENLACLCLSLTSDLDHRSRYHKTFKRDAFLVVYLYMWRRPTTMLKSWNPRKEHKQLPKMIVFNLLCSGLFRRNGGLKCMLNSCLRFCESWFPWSVFPLALRHHSFKLELSKLIPFPIPRSME